MIENECVRQNERVGGGVGWGKTHREERKTLGEERERGRDKEKSQSEKDSERKSDSERESEGGRESEKKKKEKKMLDTYYTTKCTRLCME